MSASTSVASLAPRPDGTSALAPRVLVIEDNVPVAETLQNALERAGMTVAVAGTGAEAVALKHSFRPDVVLVDLELPDTHGVTLISWLNDQRDCGIIVVTGNNTETDRIVGLELGADDYIAKPPQLRELIARVRAVYRRVNTGGRGQPAARPTNRVVIGRLVIDLQHRSVASDTGTRIDLTSAEFAALETLLEASGQPVSRDRLSETALRRPWRAEDRSVDQLIFSLRHKLPPEPDGEQLIQSVRGAGYLLRAFDMAIA